MKDKLIRAYIVKRKAGWHAVAKWIGSDGAKGTTDIGPTNKADARLSRDSLKRGYTV